MDGKRIKTTGVGEMCKASGLVAPGCAQRGLSFCRAERGFAVEILSITILTLGYPDVSILHVLVLEKQIESVGKQLF